MSLFKNLYLPSRFLIAVGILASGFAISFFLPILFPITQSLLAVFVILLIADFILLFNQSVVFSGERILPNLLSLGDNNSITLRLLNRSNLLLHCQLIDELPVQFQKRDFSLSFSSQPKKRKTIKYSLRPLRRGDYHFGNIILFVNSNIGLLQRKLTIEQTASVPTYPSVIQLKKYSLANISSLYKMQGVKKIRRIGQSMEFEQIKKYVQGDNYKNINWKATSRTAELMVNHYEDEKSQQVYSIIDTGRTMKLPFHGLSLLDHAINTSLVLSNIVLQKDDKAGIICFDKKVNTKVPASKDRQQLRKILERLYSVEENNFEASFENLFHLIRNQIRIRSLIVLYTNFENLSALKSVQHILRKISSLHLLVVVFFENTPIVEFANEPSADIQDVYLHTIAHQYTADKKQMVNTLMNYGIQTILCKPEMLTVSAINKYLELKSRGLI